MKHTNLITGLLLGLCLLITSCAPTQQQSMQRLPAAMYLKMAATTSGEKKQSYLISAADRYIEDRQLTDAGRVLASIDTDLLPPDQLVRYQLTKAHFAILHHQDQRALQLLQQAQNEQNLDSRQQYKINKLFVMVYAEQGNVAQALNHYNVMLSFCADDQQRQDTLLQTWDYLQNLPKSTTSSLASNPDLDTLQRGWLQLSMIANHSDNNADLQSELSDWQQHFPNHPANTLLPSTFQQAMPQSSKQVALLLPMSGPLAAKGTAIRNGFFAAYYADKRINPDSPKIKVIDTGSGHIEELYQQAVQQGADFVVGPLTKNNVTKLTQYNQLPVRTLALNTLSTPISNQPKLFQYGLSPMDEVQQLTDKAWQDNHTRAILITPSNSWGDNISNAISSQWQQKGGVIVDSLRFSSLGNLSSQIRSLLGLTLATSRYEQLKSSLHRRVRYVPYRREDVDVILLAAQPNAARQIRPLLKYFYAGKIPVYALSTIYQGLPNTRLDRDLDGIVFCDMPWVIAPNKTLTPPMLKLRQTVQSLWPQSYRSNVKLYALGIDAYNLVGDLTKLTMLPKFGINGATGRLYLDQDQHIYRRLLWAQIRNSKPTLLH